MTRHFIMALFLWLAGSVAAPAQSKAERLSSIRKAYAEAKKDIADNGKKGYPQMDVRIVRNDGTADGADFVVNEEQSFDYYFKRIRIQGDTDLFEPRCYFVVERWSADGHTSYREMLFDPFSAHLMFSYMKAETHAGFVVETRYYYDDEGNLIEQKHKIGGEETTAAAHSWSSGEGDQTIAMRHLVVFNDLMAQKGKEAGNHTSVPTADKAAELKHIRSLYAQAKEKIAKNDKSEVPHDVQIIIHDQDDPEMPPQKDELKYWFDLDEQGSPSCYFMSSTCEMGDHRVYSEYLFEPQDARLVFCFSQQKQNAGPALEWRYYFDAKGQCIEAKGQQSKSGPGFADKKAAGEYLDLFEAIVNPEH